jgi:hypothetical protein
MVIAPSHPRAQPRKMLKKCSRKYISVHQIKTPSFSSVGAPVVSTHRRKNCRSSHFCTFAREKSAAPIAVRRLFPPCSAWSALTARGPQTAACRVSCWPLRRRARFCAIHKRCARLRRARLLPLQPYHCCIAHSSPALSLPSSLPVLRRRRLTPRRPHLLQPLQRL